MKAPAFDYVRAQSVEDAVAILADNDGDARPLAGGQSLMPMLAMRLVEPTLLVDLNHLPGLARIEVDTALLRIGALARYSDIELSPVIAAHVPFLAEVLSYVGDRPVRNRGTIGGSLAQADPSGEAPLAALALDASVIVQGINGQRTIKVQDLLVGPYETNLDSDEIIVEVQVPIQPKQRYVFSEVARRHGDYAVLSIAALGMPTPEPNIWESVRLILGAIGPQPVVIEAASKVLAGRALNDEAIEEAVAAAVEMIDPITDTRASAEYRRHLVPIYVRRALTDLRDRWGEETA